MNAITIPSFEDTLEALIRVAQEKPVYAGNHSFLDDQGKPLDLVGRALSKLELPIEQAASGRRKPLHPNREGTLWKDVRFNILWPRIFGTDANFFDMRFDIKVAENFLVYVMLTSITEQTEKTGVDPWRDIFKKGLIKFRRLVNSPNTGFLTYMSHSQAKDLLRRVDNLTLQTLNGYLS